MLTLLAFEYRLNLFDPALPATLGKTLGGSVLGKCVLFLRTCPWGKTIIACSHDQNKSGFLEGRLFSSQSELFEYFLICYVWLDKSRPSK